MRPHIGKLSPLLGALLLCSCAQQPIKEQSNSQSVEIGTPEFCQAAAHKSEFVGKPLTLRGSYVTDLRHYSMLQGKCGNSTAGFSIGFVAKTTANRVFQDRLWQDYCGSNRATCALVLPVEVSGTLTERDGGLELDISTIELRPNNSFKGKPLRGSP